MFSLLLFIFFTSTFANESLMCIECKCIEERLTITCEQIPSIGALEGYINSEYNLDLSNIKLEDFDRDYWFVSEYIVTGFKKIKYPSEIQRKYIYVQNKQIYILI